MIEQEELRKKLMKKAKEEMSGTHLDAGTLRESILAEIGKDSIGE